MSARVMVLSLDAADPGLVRRLAAAGDMPAFARLLERAAIVDTVAPSGVYVSANWPTLFTAQQPDRHHYLCWDEIAPGTYDRRETDLGWIRSAPIWRTLSEAGRRVAVFDVPHTVIEPVDGVMVAEFACHDRHGETGSWPPELAGELHERHGRPFGSEPGPYVQFAPCDYTLREGEHRTEAETEALVAAFHRSIDIKRAASLDLLGRDDWDLFMSVMGESHCVGHQLWHLHDTAHEHHDAALVERLGGDPVVEVLRRLDALVGAHLDTLGPDDTVYVTLAHGMTAHHDGTHLLDHVLAQLEWGLEHDHGAAARLLGPLPKALQARVLRDRTSRDAPAELPPRATRRWFQTPNNTVVGSVRLNLAGREPEGRIAPGDRREVLRWLTDRLEELVNLETGGRVVERCLISDEVFRRSDGDAFADLYVEWNRDAPIERVWSPAAGTVNVPYTHWRQGDHEPGGITFAVGPGIDPGQRAGVFPVVDLGATYAAAAGVPLEGVDGRPIASILPSGAVAPAPPGPAATPARVRRRRPRWAREGAGPAATLALRRDMESRLAAVAADAEARAQAAEARSQALERALSEREAQLSVRIDDLARLAEVATMATWLPHADVPEDVLISVILPTRDRRALLETAVASVLAQSYRRFELIIVDDASRDATAAFLDGLRDDRIRSVRAGGVGACGARNAGLDVARGELVAYLDDDNRFDLHWLRAVAHTFHVRPEATSCFGARVVDDGRRLLGDPAGGQPWIHFWPWDPVAVRTGNLADMNVLAHRRGLARFDESLVYFGDWDLLLQLMEHGDPVAVPAIGAYYRTDVPGRLTESVPIADREEEAERIKQRLAPR